MVIFLNLDGSCENVTPQKIYQGSNNVTEITVVAPFASATALQIGFVLPDGLYWETSEHARYAPMEFVPQETVSGVNVWKFVLPFSVTAQQGDLYIAVNAITTDGNTTSYMVKQTIEESVLPNPPNPPNPSVYEYLQLYLARLDGRTENVANLVKSVQKIAPNAITYTTNSGIESAPIVIEGGDTAPIPANAASMIKIPLDAWQPVYSGQTVIGYSALITSAMHGQMRDGATANDLWLSFDETENGVVSGAYQGYTVSDAGDITVNVNQPVVMTVRVWNGKGLVDNVARDMIAEETARAEVEESHLQEQINELQNTGVDLTARRMVAEETARAEIAERNLQSDITAEIQRASEVENGLASDIQGLRDDINNEEHFRGMFTSVEALKAAYPTATPNDYAYIVGGNQWIWENGEWADSNKPTPNTAVPKGTSTPLMDGIGSAGVANAYAPIDHRHPSNTNKVDISGDAMTGPLELPLLLGSGAENDKGIIPVRFIDRAEFGDGTMTTDAYIQAWLKKVCRLYPNKQDCIFIGQGNPTSRMILIALIYDTGAVNADGLPQYVTGLGRQYSQSALQFGVANYVYNSNILLNDGDNINISKLSGRVGVDVERSDTGSQIGLEIGTGGKNRGLYDHGASFDKWIVYWNDNDLYIVSPNDDGDVYVNGVIPYSRSFPPLKQSKSTLISSTDTISLKLVAGQRYNITAIGIHGNLLPEYAIGGIISHDKTGVYFGMAITSAYFVALLTTTLTIAAGDVFEINGYSVG